MNKDNQDKKDANFQDRLAMFNKKPDNNPKVESKIQKKQSTNTQENQTGNVNLTEEKPKVLNVLAKRYTRKNLKGESYNMYKAVDLSQKEAIPIPKSLPLLKSFMKGLLGNIIKKTSTENTEGNTATKVDSSEEEVKRWEEYEAKLDEEIKNASAENRAQYEWKRWLFLTFEKSKIFTKTMILSAVGDLWAFTHEDFLLQDLEQMEKIKTLFINQGNCYGDCVCVTKGIPIGEGNYRLIRYDPDLNMLNLDTVLIALRSKVCVIGVKDYNCSDLLVRTSKIANTLNSHLGG